jgi:hypothetical protein
MKIRLIGCLVMLVSSAAAAWADPVEPVHLREVRQLLEQLDLSRTSYEHGPGEVSWQSPVASHTDCSGLIDHLLMHGYGYTPEAFTRWFASRRPSARRYFDAIAAGKGFTQVDSVQALQPGDLIAVKYLQRTDSTGHIMIVAQSPQPMATTAPSVPGTQQWRVSVIDSSESGHGTSDTRHKLGAGGRDHDGLGQGVLRLYADAQGKVAGFSWSVLPKSLFKGPDTEPLVIGRLQPGYTP